MRFISALLRAQAGDAHASASEPRDCRLEEPNDSFETVTVDMLINPAQKERHEPCGAAADEGRSLRRLEPDAVLLNHSPGRRRFFSESAVINWLFVESPASLLLASGECRQT